MKQYEFPDLNGQPDSERQGNSCIGPLPPGDSKHSIAHTVLALSEGFRRWDGGCYITIDIDDTLRLGTMIPGQQTGIRNIGGPVVTASNLAITASAEDPWLRVFDFASGEELQKFPLPVPAVATPMSYTLDGRQYIVVAAGAMGTGLCPQAIRSSCSPLTNYRPQETRRYVRDSITGCFVFSRTQGSKR